MLEHDLMAIELVALGPVISNTIIKQTHMNYKAPTNSLMATTKVPEAILV